MAQAIQTRTAPAKHPRPAPRSLTILVSSQGVYAEHLLHRGVYFKGGVPKQNLLDS